MNIAFDIDGVLTDIESFQLKYGKSFFSKKYGMEIENENEFDIKEIFNCTDKQRLEFWKKYLIYYSIMIPVREGFKPLIDKLHDDGNRIYIITSRVFTDKSNSLGKIMRFIVEEWLKFNKIKYDEIIFCNEDKTNAIKQHSINVMIEDNVKNIYDISKITNVICYPARYNKDCDCKYRTSDVSEIYQIINNIKYGKNNTYNSSELTGKASIDMPWIRNFYRIEQQNIQYPKQTIYEYMYDKNKNNLNSDALLYFGKIYSFREFFKLIDECSKAFKINGVQCGDIVTICMPNTPEGIISFYALNKIGAVANMIHPLSSEIEIKNYLNEVKSKLLVMIDICYSKVNKIINETDVEKVIVVSPKDSMPILMNAGYSLLNYKKQEKIDYGTKYEIWKDFLNSGKNYNGIIESSYQENNLAVLLHTGGTTGTPKGVMITNENFNMNVEQLKGTIPSYKKGDSLLAITPIFHGFGLADCIHTALCVNMSVNLLPQYNSKIFTSTLLRDKPNLILGVPTLWDAMLNNERLKNKELSFLKVLISGGDNLPINLENEMNAFLKLHNAPNNIFKGFGMTECLAACTFTNINANPISSIGIPLPLNNIKIVNLGTCDELDYGEYGEICISGPTQMLGYYHNEKETNDILKVHEDGKIWLHTGDIGYVTKEGIVYYVQRSKRIIISSGYNIYPIQIENVIKENENVKDCIVVAKPHEYKVNVAKAYVVLKDDCLEKSFVEQEIKELCASKLSKFSLPNEYEFRTDLPKTLLGKIDYHLLEKETADNYYAKKLNLKR